MGFAELVIASGTLRIDERLCYGVSGSCIGSAVSETHGVGGRALLLYHMDDYDDVGPSFRDR